jgi:PAS domain S-box-containing protein
MATPSVDEAGASSRAARAGGKQLAAGAGLRRQARSVVAVYAVAASAWIATSDGLSALIARDASDLAQLGMLKGFAFVAATAAILHLLLRRTVTTVESSLAAAAHEKEQRRRADAIVACTNDAILSISSDGLITSWNPAASRMFGYAASEVLGSPIARLIPEDRREKELSLASRVQSGHTVEALETLRLRRDGTTLPVSITFSPLRGEGGPSGAPLGGVSEIVRDITERRRAEANLEREQRFTRGLVEAMPLIFYLYDEGGRFLRWNDELEKVSGYPGSELLQKHPLDFFAGTEKALVEARIGQVFTRGEASIEASFVTKDGRSIPYFFTGKRIVLDGTPCLIGVGIDISERRRAEHDLRQSEERYRSTLDSIMEGCQLLDFDLRYLYLNEAAEVHNKRPNTELLGRSMPDVWPGIEGTAVFAMLARCLRERLPLHGETEFTFPDGSTGWFDVRAQPVPEGIFVLSIDISERKRAERALRDLNEQLELKIAERTRDLEAARERAEAADHIKSAFLATMSHELRTPLNSIIGFTGIVLQRLAGPLTDEQAKQLGMVQGSARHLLDLINDVLDISKIEAGQLLVRPAHFELPASIERVCASVVPLAEKKGLRLSVSVAPGLGAMQSDQRRVEQILLNLLNNAIKFTDRGEVTLSAECWEETAVSGAAPVAAIRIRVTDTGIGMRTEDMGKLFQPFRQIDTGLQRLHEGSGLGLAICRRLTDLLGGTIVAQSTWGQVSVFTVVLPTSWRQAA